MSAPLFQLFQMGKFPFLGVGLGLAIRVFKSFIGCWTPSAPVRFEPSSARLLTLPPEILLKIIDSSIEHPEPTLALLRRTHRCFFSLIPRRDVRNKPSRAALNDQLRIAESNFSFLFPPDHFACLSCLRVKPAWRFPDNFEILKQSPEGFCLQCGIWLRLYLPERHIIYGGLVYRRCMACGRFHAGRCGAPRRIGPFYSATLLGLFESFRKRPLTPIPKPVPRTWSEVSKSIPIAFLMLYTLLASMRCCQKPGLSLEQIIDRP